MAPHSDLQGVKPTVTIAANYTKNSTKGVSRVTFHKLGLVRVKSEK